MTEQHIAPSDTGYDSLVSISPSLADIIVTRRAGSTFSSLTNDYNLPFDDQTRICELINQSFSTGLNDGDLYWEPELERGYVAELLKDGGRVLDIGCGMEGLWTQAMATRFSKAEVLGIDLVPVDVDWAPPNASFEVMDVGNGFECFHDRSFDVIHIRFTCPWIGYDNHMTAFRRLLKAGGVLLIEEGKGELYHSDGSVGVPTWYFTREGFESWSSHFERLVPLIASNETFIEEDKAYGKFLQVEERVIQVHLGLQSELHEHIPSQLTGKLMRESLIAYFQLKHIEDDGTVANRERLLRLRKAWPERDAGLFQPFKQIWARKG